MRAAGDRRAEAARALRAQAWMVAALMRAERLPDAQTWIAGDGDGPQARAARLREWNKRWDAWDRAFAANRRRQNRGTVGHRRAEGQPRA